MKNKKIDDTGLSIVKLLHDGRRSFKEIGMITGLSEATVRNKVNRMVEDGLVDIKALISTKNLPTGYMTVYVGVCLNSPAMKKIAEDMSTLPGVVSVALVTGRFNLFLTVVLKPDFELIDFFNAMLAAHSDQICSTETFFVYDSMNLKTPFPYE